MLLVLWEYQVKLDRVEEFESMYRPDGPWTHFFRDCPAFVSITLWKDLRRPGRYLVADRWTSEMMYVEFVQERATPIAELSARGARLWTSEREVGRYELRD